MSEGFRIIHSPFMLNITIKLYNAKEGALPTRKKNGVCKPRFSLHEYCEGSSIGVPGFVANAQPVSADSPEGLISDKDIAPVKKIIVIIYPVVVHSQTTPAMTLISNKQQRRSDTYQGPGYKSSDSSGVIIIGC
jgi:hypothetical protein